MNDEAEYYEQTNVMKLSCQLMRIHSYSGFAFSSPHSDTSGFNGTFSPQGCNVVQAISEYELDLPQDVEYDYRGNK